MKKRTGLIAILLIVATFVSGWYFLFSPVGGSESKIVSFNDDTDAILVANKVKEEGLVRSETVLAALLISGKYPSGAYELSSDMNVFEVVKVMNEGPQLLWVTVIPGWRKEQIAEKLRPKFNWTDKDESDFLSFPEGKFFPDSYLIPKNATGREIAKRMQSRFNEKFAPLAPKFLAANIKEDTALKIASLLQKESGGDDMPIIAGIIWNRLLKGMGLKIDATVQYGKGKVGDRWWPVVTVSDYAKVDSPFNTYLIKGLPPAPIASPGLAAIEAVLNSAETDCLYYIHDHYGQIHCSPTYEGHLENVEKFLK